MRWPRDPRELAAEQERLAAEVWTAWRPLGRYTVGGVFVCFDQASPGMDWLVTAPSQPPPAVTT
jgi:hypothetical protein